MASSLPLKIFIGFDSRQVVSFTVLAMSIMQRASKPVAIIPLILETLPITRRGLTPFTFSRFLVPWLSDFEGQSVFLDADIILRDDIHKMARCNDGVSDVMVVKHEGSLEFERPSVMLFNNAKCADLTPQFVESPSNQLFDFKWARKVGDLPKEWNHLVGYEAPNPKAKLAHFTQGVPVFPETSKSEFASEWISLMSRATSSRSWGEIMGSSVHAQHVRERLKEVKEDAA